MNAPETITSEIQKLEPSAIIELFEMDATAFGGDLLRFHAGTNGLRQNLVWQGNAYTAFPIKASGFDMSGNGQLPRPKLQVANVTGAITLLVLTYDDLLGAKVTRKRTMAKYLDAVNYPARRNVLLQSEALNVSPWVSNDVSVSSGGDFYDGSIPFWTIAKTTTGSSASRGQEFGAVAAGATRTATVALMAGTNSSVSVGLYANTALWGTLANSSAEVISGPGALSNSTGALWTVTGLSSSVPTLLQVTRTYLTADTAGLYIYPGTPTSQVIGASVKATRAQVEAGVTPTQYESVGSSSSQNPSADETAEFADDIFFIDRKVTETRDLVEFELAAAFDVAGVQLPRRQIIQNVCVWRYRGGECGWTTPEDRRNLLIYSEEFQQSYWAKLGGGTGVSPVVTANQAANPVNGLVNADRVVFNKGAGTASADQSLLQAQSASVIGQIYTMSFWARSADANTYTMRTDFSGSSATPPLISVTPTWQRFSASLNVGATDTVRQPSLRLRGGQGTSNTADIFLWGFQLDLGNAATDYQPVGASYTNPNYYDANDAAVGSAGLDVCGKRLSSCKARFGENNPLPFGSFPAAGLTR